MFEPLEWLDECERALADAEYLAVRLARASSHADGDLTALRLRIAALRAEFGRARAELGMEQRRRAIHPDWAGGKSPWCAGGEHS